MTGGEGQVEAGAVILDECFDASTLQLLRDQAVASATAAGVPPDLAPDVLIAVHELAANAVRHGAGTGRLVMRAAVGVLQCQVSDAGPGTGHWPVRPGHGLWIVETLARQLRARSGPGGSQITAVFGWQ